MTWARLSVGRSSAGPEAKRVAVLGTGGLAHWVRLPEMGRINVEFDRWFLDCLVTGHAADVAVRYPKTNQLERDAGNGGHEIRQWLAVAGAMAEGLTPRLLAYEPIPGCGTGVMVWSSN